MHRFAYFRRVFADAINQELVHGAARRRAEARAFLAAGASW